MVCGWGVWLVGLRGWLFGFGLVVLGWLCWFGFGWLYVTCIYFFCRFVLLQWLCLLVVVFVCCCFVGLVWCLCLGFNFWLGTLVFGFVVLDFGLFVFVLF